MSEQQEVRPTGRRRVQRFGFVLCLVLVVVGILFNVVMMFGQRWYESAAPMYVSTLVLCLAVIVGLLAILAED